MADIVRRLVEGKLDPLALPVREGSRYHRATRQIAAFMEQLCDREEYPEDMKRLDTMLTEVEIESAYAYFTLGYRWGGQMMLAMLQEEDTTFRKEKENKEEEQC